MLKCSLTLLCAIAALSGMACDSSTDSDDQGNAGDTKKDLVIAHPKDSMPVTEGHWYRPAAGISWQWQLSGAVNGSYAVKLYDIDLFESSRETIQSLQSAGKKVICYFSAGSSENWRPDDSSFLSADRGKDMDGWPGEKWLDIRSASVRKAMRARLQLAADKGCDGVEPDNVQGYATATGFSLTADDQLDFNIFLANAAHRLGLAVALKNDGPQVKDLLEYFDFSVNEECFAFDECADWEPFVTAGKPVLNAEYTPSLKSNASARADLCKASAAIGFSTLVLPLELDDSFRYSCGD